MWCSSFGKKEAPFSVRMNTQDATTRCHPHRLGKISDRAHQLEIESNQSHRPLIISGQGRQIQEFVGLIPDYHGSRITVSSCCAAVWEEASIPGKRMAAGLSAPICSSAMSG